MRKYGLIGYPLSHSFSKKYFTDKFEREGYSECVYENFPLNDETALADFLQNPLQLEGFNITIPWKEKVLPFLHWTSPAVTAIGACNCVRLSHGKMFGFNTDVKGFTDSLKPLLNSNHKKALILGTGGAAKAVAYALRMLAIEYVFVSRNGGEGRMSYADISKEIMEHHLLIINTTPLGMYPDISAAPPLPYESIGSSHYLFDLTYNPAVTTFLQVGHDRGAVIKNGQDMLIIQAEESWKIWNADIATLMA